MNFIGIIRILLTIFLILFITTMCNEKPRGQKIEIKTSEGNIYVILYNDTPLHQKNFLENVKNKIYDNAPFHRIIEDFMIQAGQQNGDSLTNENLILPEFNTKHFFHKYGAIGAARWGNDVNPSKKSSNIQFYIVTGRKYFDMEIDRLQKERFEKLKQTIYRELQDSIKDEIKKFYREGNKEKIKELRTKIQEETEVKSKERENESKFTIAQKKVYAEQGGVPHLDGEYTVFGEVYKGMDVVSKISHMETNDADKPLKKVTITTIKIID